jgi:transcriptional regulator with XRE-family HTH domain
MRHREVSIAFGRVLREARRSRKLSQEQLALRGGLDRTYASMMERGLRQPTVAVLLRLSEVLDIAATTLLHRTIEELSRQRAKVSRPH